MQGELGELENRIDRVVSLCQRLWMENQTLRDQMIQEQAENRKLSEKLSTVLDRLETMLKAFPQPQSDTESQGDAQ